MSNSNENFDGSVTIGKNLDVGGDLDVKANAYMRHNLNVEGWLQAPNIKGGINKGLYVSLSALKAAWASPEVGWVAGVGASSPQLYVAVKTTNGVEWTAQTKTDGSAVAYVIDKGEDGKDGADGKDGVDGKDGEDGKDGCVLFPTFEVVAENGELVLYGYAPDEVTELQDRVFVDDDCCLTITV